MKMSGSFLIPVVMLFSIRTVCNVVCIAIVLAAILLLLEHYNCALFVFIICLHLSECTHSPKYKTRLLYLEVCECVLERFSRNFFKQFFFEHILQVATVSESRPCTHTM